MAKPPHDRQRDRVSDILDTTWDLLMEIDQLDDEGIQEELSALREGVESQLPKMLSIVGVPNEKHQAVLDMMGDGSPAEEAINDCMTGE